jgi:hypothetical protein
MDGGQQSRETVWLATDWEGLEFLRLATDTSRLLLRTSFGWNVCVCSTQDLVSMRSMRLLDRNLYFSNTQHLSVTPGCTIRILPVTESFIERHHLSTSPLKLWRCTKVSFLRIHMPQPHHRPNLRKKGCRPQALSIAQQALLKHVGRQNSNSSHTLHTTRRRVQQIDDGWDRGIETIIPVDRRGLQTLAYHILAESRNVTAIAFPEQAITNE